jgi:hypothetical protein
MKKAEIISALKEGRSNFLDAIHDLSDQEMENSIVFADWTVKDILVHLTRWEAELVKLLWQARQGIMPSTAHFSQESVDDINARWYKESRARPFEIVLDDFYGIRTQSIRRVEALKEKLLVDPSIFPWLNGEPLWKWIAGDSFEHEAEHENQIRIWKVGKGEK